MTKAAEIKELLKRADVTADALARPGADRKHEAATLRRYLVRVCHILTDIEAEVTVAHESPRASRLPLIDQQTAEPVLGIK